MTSPEIIERWASLCRVDAADSRGKLEKVSQQQRIPGKNITQHYEDTASLFSQDNDSSDIGDGDRANWEVEVIAPRVNLRSSIRGILTPYPGNFEVLPVERDVPDQEMAGLESSTLQHYDKGPDLAADGFGSRESGKAGWVTTREEWKTKPGTSLVKSEENLEPKFSIDSGYESIARRASCFPKFEFSRPVSRVLECSVPSVEKVNKWLEFTRLPSNESWALQQEILQGLMTPSIYCPAISEIDPSSEKVVFGWYYLDFAMHWDALLAQFKLELISSFRGGIECELVTGLIAALYQFVQAEELLAIAEETCRVAEHPLVDEEVWVDAIDCCCNTEYERYCALEFCKSALSVLQTYRAWKDFSMPDGDQELEVEFQLECETWFEKGYLLPSRWTDEENEIMHWEEESNHLRAEIMRLENEWKPIQEQERKAKTWDIIVELREESDKKRNEILRLGNEWQRIQTEELTLAYLD